MQIGILEPKQFSEVAYKELNKLGEVNIFYGEGLEEFLKHLDVLFVRLSYNIDKNFLFNCRNLKWICSPTTAHNHLDEKLLKKRGIKIISLKNEKNFLKKIRATPEHTFGLILSSLRKYGIAFDQVKKGFWERDVCKGSELFGKTVGIIGLGRVGYQVACYCETFGAKIRWFDNNQVKSKKSWFKHSDSCSMIKKSDIVVLTASYRNNQKPIFKKKQIDLLSNKYFVNTSRGELLDEKYLIKFLKKNNVLGIALDVIQNENENENLQNWLKVIKSNNNILITPHIGGVTGESMEKTEIFITHKLKKFI